MVRDELPNEVQRQQLCDLVAQALIEIRMLCWNNKPAQAADLADAFHNLPREMYGWGGFGWETLTKGLAQYRQKYEGTVGLDYAVEVERIRGGLDALHPTSPRRKDPLAEGAARGALGELPLGRGDTVGIYPVFNPPVPELVFDTDGKCLLDAYEALDEIVQPRGCCR